MVRMPMSSRNDIDSLDTVKPEIGRDSRLTGADPVFDKVSVPSLIPCRDAASAIDQHRRPTRKAENYGITLANVQERDSKTPWNEVMRNRVPDQREPHNGEQPR